MRAPLFDALPRGLVLAALVGAAGAIGPVPAAAAAAEFGPVPAIEADAKKAELGKRLFFDKRLSGDAAISCASCHVPDKGFAVCVDPPPKAGVPSSPRTPRAGRAPKLSCSVHKRSHPGRTARVAIPILSWVPSIAEVQTFSGMAFEGIAIAGSIDPDPG